MKWAAAKVSDYNSEYPSSNLSMLLRFFSVPFTSQLPEGDGTNYLYNLLLMSVAITAYSLYVGSLHLRVTTITDCRMPHGRAISVLSLVI